MVCQEKLKTNMQIMIPDIPDGVWNISSTPDKRNRMMSIEGLEKLIGSIVKIKPTVIRSETGGYHQGQMASGRK